MVYVCQGAVDDEPVECDARDDLSNYFDSCSSFVKDTFVDTVDEEVGEKLEKEGTVCEDLDLNPNEDETSWSYFHLFYNDCRNLQNIQNMRSQIIINRIDNLLPSINKTASLDLLKILIKVILHVLKGLALVQLTCLSHLVNVLLQTVSS